MDRADDLRRSPVPSPSRREGATSFPEPGPRRRGECGGGRGGGRGGRAGLLELFSRWDRAGGLLTAPDIARSLGRLRLALDDVADCAIFCDRSYQRVLIHRGPGYEALILCWRSGQRSPIHDHAGSLCGVYVIEGTATETRYAASPCGRLVPLRSRPAGPGSLCVSRDADIHQMANLEPEGRDLVSLHLYSPPLAGSRIYSLADTTLADHDVLGPSRPRTITAEIRVDGPHGPSRSHPAGVRQVAP